MDELGWADFSGNGRAGFVSVAGEIHTGRFTGTGGFSEDLAAVKSGKYWGFINRAGDYVIEPRFSSAAQFSEGLASVMNPSKLWGAINNEGQLVIDYTTTKPLMFKEGRSTFYKGGNNEIVGIIDIGGNEVLVPGSRRIFPFENGFASMETFNIKDHGLIDTTGKVVKRGISNGMIKPVGSEIAYAKLSLDGALPLHYFADSNGNEFYEP
jgi:hypothetical protein